MTDNALYAMYCITYNTSTIFECYKYLKNMIGTLIML